MDGILLIDKPAGYTSHDIVAIVKRAYHLKKVGHTGTLDPLATGILPLCINAATKFAGLLIHSDKSYETTLKWGEATDSYDSNGKILETRPVPAEIDRLLREALPLFTGAIQQMPPPYSAVKVAGKPLYWWARKGQAREVPARDVTIREIQILGSNPATATLGVSCSKGTFVRSLVHDLGQHIGCGAHVVVLRRLRTGPFHVNQSISLDEIKGAAPHEAALEKWLIPVDTITRPSLEP